jgi:hypothetical protein
MVIVLLGLGAAQAAEPKKRSAGDERPLPNRVAVTQPFGLSDVKLLDGPVKEMQERTRRYLHDLDSDRLLHNFRVTAALPSSAQPLGGWEAPNCELRGHFVGHFLSACAMMYASTGNKELKAKADAMVAELAKCQKALGGQYLSAFPESWFERVETGKRVWAPWYTMHKIMAGLLDMYVYCGNEQALGVLKNLAKWAKGRIDKLSDEQLAQMLRVEFGGTNEVLYNLAAITGDPDHMALAHKFDQPFFFDPLAVGRDNLTGLHANTHIPKAIGAARRYELTGEERYRKIAGFFWDCVVNTRMYATGGTSDGEHWRKPNELAGTLHATNQETCCTHNMLKLTRHLFEWTADARYADYYERALYNGIFGTQDPKTGMMMYFVPLGAGYFKLFNTPDTSFWCCTGTGVESFAKPADSIYFHNDNALFVNLFIASEVNWADKGVRVEQRTAFPEEAGTTLICHAKKPAEFALNIRVPYWATRGVEVKINGSKETTKADPCSYLKLNRVWKDGDQVEVGLPMSLHVHAMPDDKTLQAFMYGPVVLLGRLGTEGLTEDRFYAMNQGAFGDPVPAPTFVASTDDLAAWVKPVEGQPLTFRATGQKRDVAFEPFYKLFGQRYAVYWRVFKQGSKEYRAFLDEQAAEEARQREREGRLVDSVTPMNRKEESAHKMRGERTQAGLHMGKPWRHSSDGGWFSYDMKVLPDQKMFLVCTYWGSDGGARTFDIQVDGRKIATQTLNNNAPNKFFDVTYEIPAELISGKERVTVRFQAHPDSFAGGVFGCAILKEKK